MFLNSVPQSKHFVAKLSAIAPQAGHFLTSPNLSDCVDSMFCFELFFVISKIMRTFATQKGVYASTGIMARETAAVSETEIITNKR